MHRTPTPRNDRLEKLLQERDHVRIKLSLIRDRDNPDLSRIDDLHRELSDLEKQVKAAERQQGWNGG